MRLAAAPRPRPAIAALPRYRPGRSAADAVADHGVEAAVELASNELPLPPLPSVARALEGRDLARYPDHGAGELRRALAEGLGTAPDRIAVGCGSVGLLQQLALAFTGPGDEVVHGAPSFEAYPVLAGLTGATAVPVPLRHQTIDTVALAAAVGPRTRLVLVANPNNPTGTAVRSSELLALADALPDDCLLVVDEAYREFVTGADVPDAIELLGDRPDVAVLRTFSKAHGLAALRVGYLVAHPDVVAAVDRVLLPFAVNGLGQAAALASLAAPDELRDRVAGVVAERDLVAARLRAAGWSVPDAQGNFTWLPAGDAAGPLARALERRGVVTRPFAGLGVRVAVGTAPENDAFFAALVAAADEVDLAGSWTLPTGPAGRVVADWIDRLDAVAVRLRTHAADRFEGLTEPDPGGTERWEAGQVWAHLAEQGPYWLDQLDRLLAATAAGATDPVPFGRTKADPHRIAAIADGRHRPVAEHHAALARSLDRLRARLLELDAAAWQAVGRHETLGDLTVAEQLQHFHVGHLEEHADQLDGLVVRR